MATLDVTPGEVVITRSLDPEVERQVDADPIQTEVIRHALNSVAAQMKISLRRAAFSPIIYEMIDFAAAIYDRRVRLLAQAEAMPLFMGTLNTCVERCVASVGGETALEQGDILLTTFGYDTGSHPQDLAIVMPIFLDGQLVGYAAVKAHQMDIGAKDPYSTDTVDNLQEGLIVPGVKLYANGVRNEALYRTIIANSRLPVALAGDLAAQIACCHAGAQGLTRLIERYGHDVFAQSVERMFDHGEALVRAFLERIPDGRYTSEGVIDSNGVDDDPIPFEVSVEISGSDCIIDFTNAPPTQAGPTNCPLPGTVSAARLAITCLAGGDDVAHEGYMRPIEIRTRTNTMFHPLSPAPIYLYGWPGMQALDVIHRALARVAPDLVRAGSGSDACGSVWWGYWKGGQIWAQGFDHFVGHGALSNGDGGPPLMHMAVSGIRNTPAEIIEQRAPMIVRRFQLATDSAGAGEHIGGLGMDIEYEMTQPSYLTSVIERTRNAPWGLQGGAEGRPNAIAIEHPDGSVELMPGKATRVPLAAGDRVTIRTAGGGGFGDPARRDPEAVRRDVARGYVSEQAARTTYPHALEPVA